MGSETPLRLEVTQPQPHDGRVPCAFCLIPCDVTPVMVVVRGGESEYVYLAEPPYVCGRCLHGGVDAMIQELRNRAEASRRAAAQYDAWADGGLDVPPDLQSVLGNSESLRWLLGDKPPTV